MKHNAIVLIAVFIALLVIIVAAIAKTKDGSHKKKYQEIIMFAYIFGVFIILVSGVEWLHKSEKIGTFIPMIVASLIMTGFAVLMYILLDKN
jgi:membrane-associated HD superfamily phosphohydrolase